MSVTTLARELQPNALRLRDDLPFFSRNALKIRTKTGELILLNFNRAQTYIHQRVEDQKARTGKVRAIIVKGRKQGSSTYVEARCFHAAWKPGDTAAQVFILTHEQDATDTIFGMAQTFYDNLPKDAKPPVDSSNAKEIVFADNQSGYRVSTAGSKDTGRSATYQYFHGSEVPLWPNAESHVAGAMRTVGNLPGTEIFLEATGNGIGNVFYRYAMAALRGESDFELIFVPWFWDDTLQLACPDGWNPSQEWLDYAKAHGLTWEQLYWAYNENRGLAIALGTSPDQPCWMFKQEFPSTVDEAFQTNENSFIPGGLVLKARRPSEKIIGTGPVILGADIARIRDKLALVDRCGRRLGERICEKIDPGGSVEFVTGQVDQALHRINPDQCCIDVSEGTGAAVYEALCNLGWDIMVPVNFGSSPIGRGPTGDRMYANRRAEMADAFRDWFTQELPVQIPDNDELHGEITAAVWGPNATRYQTGNNQLILEPKAKIIERLTYSPDWFDACILTFAMPFAAGAQSWQTGGRERKRRSRTGY